VRGRACAHKRITYGKNRQVRTEYKNYHPNPTIVPGVKMEYTTVKQK